MAPEQARDSHNADIRADIYALGCVLYHALTGQVPFPDKNMVNKMIGHATQTPKRLAELRPDLPDGLQAILDWMMAKDPAQRYPTPDRAAQALQVFLMAGEEPARPLEADADMAAYLRWLQAGESAPVAAPVAMPVVQVERVAAPRRPPVRADDERVLGPDDSRMDADGRGGRRARGVRRGVLHRVPRAARMRASERLP